VSQGSGSASLPWAGMAVFFIDTGTGQVATLAQLVEAGVTDPAETPPRPWHPIQGTRDATTMWYAVMRKRERGVFIGTLVLRHSAHHASLLQSGWQEVEPEEIRAFMRAKPGQDRTEAKPVTRPPAEAECPAWRSERGPDDPRS
jgi:hypothetical protein